MTNELEKNTSINTLIKQIGIFLLPIIATKLVDIFLITIPIWIQVFVLLACGVFAAYNFMLLPFENQRLTKIKAYINNLEFEKATDELNSKVLYKGKKARFKETRLWHTIHTMTGNLVEAYKATQKLFKLTMTDTEYRAALICRAITAFDAGNYRLMREIIEKFGTNTDKDIGEGLLAESLKAYTLKISGQPSEAKKMLRSALDTFGEGQEAVTAYINLAFYEDLESNTLEAVHILKKAKIALEKRNDKLLISTLYHNLLLWLIKLGEIEPARSLLQEYEGKINKKDKDQYLEFLNEKLIFARQISDASIIEDVYKIFRDQIKPYLSYEKALLLTVNLLRMESGNKEKTEDNLRSIQKRLDSIFALKFPNNWYAIKEIFYALKELEKDGVDHEWDNLYENLLQKTDELKNEIKDFRSHIPESITSIHYDWILEELTLHKYSARKEADYNGQFFTKLFSLADSMVMIASDAQNDLLKARACTLFCDEFSAFGSSMGKAVVDSFRITAQRHLRELERIVEAHPTENEFAEFSIACGRFSLLIEENALKAQAWYNEFEKRKVSALHYAPWLRGYLKELEAALSPMPPRVEA